MRARIVADLPALVLWEWVTGFGPATCSLAGQEACSDWLLGKAERGTGLEPATSSLEG